MIVLLCAMDIHYAIQREQTIPSLNAGQRKFRFGAALERKLLFIHRSLLSTLRKK
jgi:hypothetical protein